MPNPRKRGERGTHLSRAVLAPALVAALVVATPAAAAPKPLRFAPVADAAVSTARPHAHYGGRRWLRAGGKARWRSLLRFRIAGFFGRPRRVTLVLQSAGVRHPRLRVRAVRGHRWGERRVTGASAPHARHGGTRIRVRRCRRRRCVLTANLTRAVRRSGTFDFVLTAPRRRVRVRSREARRGAPRLIVALRAGSVVPGAPPPPAGGAPGQAMRPFGPVPGVWTTAGELASRPTAGAAWRSIKSAADAPPGIADIADQNSDQDVNTMAAALVYARTGVAAYRAKAAAAIGAAIGTEVGGETLALGRNLASYVIAADLIGLPAYDAALDARFRGWLSAVRTENLGGLTLISTNETRPNNWGTMTGASRVAADVYLGDNADLARAATVFRGWLGERAAYTGFSFGDLSWQADPSAPMGIDPPGAVRLGLSLDGALPDEMRRGCAFVLPPCHTAYAWEGLQGAVVEAEILWRRGFDAFGWQSNAILRAARFIQRLDALYGGWWAASDDRWQPWIINHAYGTSLPAASPAGAGKIMGWADWVFG